MPILFHTGNESPVEVYVNNTGLMFSLAEKYNALLVFAGHSLECDVSLVCACYLNSFSDFFSFPSR